MKSYVFVCYFVLLVVMGFRVLYFAIIFRCNYVKLYRKRTGNKFPGYNYWSIFKQPCIYDDNLRILQRKAYKSFKLFAIVFFMGIAGFLVFAMFLLSVK